MSVGNDQYPILSVELFPTANTLCFYQQCSIEYYFFFDLQLKDIDDTVRKIRSKTYNNSYEELCVE